MADWPSEEFNIIYVCSDSGRVVYIHSSLSNVKYAGINSPHIDDLARLICGREPKTRHERRVEVLANEEFARRYMIVKKGAKINLEEHIKEIQHVHDFAASNALLQPELQPEEAEEGEL